MITMETQRTHIRYPHRWPGLVNAQGQKVVFDFYFPHMNMEQYWFHFRKMIRHLSVLETSRKIFQCANLSEINKQTNKKSLLYARVRSIVPFALSI
jgi:hypothetical protein